MVVGQLQPLGVVTYFSWMALTRTAKLDSDQMSGVTAAAPPAAVVGTDSDCSGECGPGRGDRPGERSTSRDMLPLV